VSNLLSQSQRHFLKLPFAKGGVLIDRVLPRTSAEGKLLIGDVLVAIGGVPIDSAGMVNYEGYRVPFHIMAEHKLVGDSLTLRIWRQQHFLEVDLELSLPPFVHEFRLSYDTPPQYLIFGGLVFMPLNRNYLQSARPSSSLIYEHVFRETENPGTRREQVILIVGVLPSPVNAGYTNLKDYVVNRVNGIPIQSLKHLKNVLAHLKDKAKYYRFESEWNPALVVLDKEAVYREHERILQRYGITQGEQL